MVVPITFLRNLDNASKRWYIVSDVVVLLENIKFLSNYILGDPMCSLMTPVKLENIIDKKCEENPYGRCLYVKQSIERLGSLCRYVSYDGEADREEDPSTPLSLQDAHRAVIECCIRMKSHGSHVVLVTKYGYLHKFAEKCGIHVYDIEYLMSGPLQLLRLWNRRRFGRRNQLLFNDDNNNDCLIPPFGENLRVNAHGAIYRGYRYKPIYYKRSNYQRPNYHNALIN